MSEVKKKNAPAEPKRTSLKTCKKYTPVLNKMQGDNQMKKILAHILKHGNITDKEAMKSPIYSRRLGARIWELKNDYNIPIETQMIYEKRRKKVIPHANYYIGD